MLTLYGSAMSRAHRVMWALKELGLAYEHVPTHFHDGSTHHPDFLLINPNGRVPALDDNGLVLFESLAINLHLALKYRGAISPTNAAEQSLAMQWSFWVANEVEHPLLFAACNRFLFEPQARNQDEAVMAEQKLARPWRVLDAHLHRRPYLLGDRFTVADLNVAAVMTLIPIAGIPIAEFKRMQTWLDRCLERPAAADWKPIKFTIPRPATSMDLLRMFI